MKKLKELFILLTILVAALSVVTANAVSKPIIIYNSHNIGVISETISTATNEATPDSTPTATVTPTATATNGATATATNTSNPGTSASVSPSSTAEGTLTPTASASASPSPTAENTADVSGSPTVTATPTATAKVTAAPTKKPSNVEPTKDNYDPNRVTQAPPTLPPEVTLNPEELATPVPELTAEPITGPSGQKGSNAATGLLILFIVLILLLAADIAVIIWRKKMGYENMINNGITRRKVRDDLCDYPEDALPSDIEQAIEEDAQETETTEE